MTLYRQYRPNRFVDLIGQDTARTILSQALLKKRLSHAYLFSGSRGTGKTSSARIFARAICCTQRSEDGEPCNNCESCTAMLQGHTPDLIEIDAASNRGIEDIRLLREQAQYPPIQLSHKVYIIDEAHMLTGDAFNALLKTLEEPPAHAVFILATTELHKVPITIRSRCQLVSFMRGSVDDITRKLSHIAKQEKWKTEAAALTLVAEHSDGGYRDAETILEQLMTLHDALTVDVVVESLGVISDAARAELLAAVRAQQPDTVRTLLAREATGPAKRYEAIISSLISDIRSDTKLSAFDTYFLEQLLEAYILQKSSPSASLPLEIACLKACYFPGSSGTSTTATPLERKIDSISSKPADSHSSSSTQSFTEHAPIKKELAQVVVPKPSSTPPPAAVPVVELREKTDQTFTANIRQAWKEVVHEIAADNAPLAQALRQAKIHTAEAGLVLVHVKYKFHCDKLNEKKHKMLVEKLLKEHTKEPWLISYEFNQQVAASPAKKQLAEGDVPVAIQPVDFQDVAAIFTANPSAKPTSAN